MKKLTIYKWTLIVPVVFLFATNVFAFEVISRDPGTIDRGLQNNQLKRLKSGVFNDHTYQIIKDPTGSAPTKLVERFEARFDDCDPIRRHGKSLTTDCNSGRTRTEVAPQVLTLKQQWSKPSPKEFWYGYSIYFPEDYVSQSKYVAPYLVQFWQGDKGESGPAPTINFAESSGVFRGNGSQISAGEELRGKWYRVEMHIRWSTSSDGFVRIYADNRLVFEIENARTANRDKVFLKYGIYRHKDVTTV